MRKTFLFIAGAMLSAAAFAAPSVFASQAPAAAAAPAGDVAKGKASFEHTGCYQCHGLQGQGGREGPRIASPVPLAWPALSAFVRTTKGDMPPYTEKVLSNQDLADVYAYLRSIPPAPDFKTIPMLNGMMTTAPAQR
jgi:ubiquinol-cytochrome c reductase cytochrome c subunit